LLPTGLAQL